MTTVTLTAPQQPKKAMSEVRTATTMSMMGAPAYTPISKLLVSPMSFSFRISCAYNKVKLPE